MYSSSVKFYSPAHILCGLMLARKGWLSASEAEILSQGLALSSCFIRSRQLSFREGMLSILAWMSLSSEAFVQIQLAVLKAKSGSPISRKQSREPTLKRSHFSSKWFSLRISGAMKPRVPVLIRPTGEIPASFFMIEDPKSPKKTPLSLVQLLKRILSGLISLWMKPAAWSSFKLWRTLQIMFRMSSQLQSAACCWRQLIMLPAPAFCMAMITQSLVSQTPIRGERLNFLSFSRLTISFEMTIFSSWLAMLDFFQKTFNATSSFEIKFCPIQTLEVEPRPISLSNLKCFQKQVKIVCLAKCLQKLMKFQKFSVQMIVSKFFLFNFISQTPTFSIDLL